MNRVSQKLHEYGAERITYHEAVQDLCDACGWHDWTCYALERKVIDLRFLWLALNWWRTHAPQRYFYSTLVVEDYSLAFGINQERR